jgi:hypothetical protein
MIFGKLEVGDHFILPNHIPTRDGVPSPADVHSLEVFRKIETIPNGCNAAKWKMPAEGSNIFFSEEAAVIKLV